MWAGRRGGREEEKGGGEGRIIYRTREWMEGMERREMGASGGDVSRESNMDGLGKKKAGLPVRICDSGVF